MNLENCKIYVMVATATLDSMTKQCSEGITDGEETQEQIVLPSSSQHFSIALPCYQGQALKGGWYCYLWLINLRTDRTWWFSCMLRMVC